MLETPWKELSFVAFDTETSGPYPLGNEIVEVGLVKWEAGREVASFDQLIKPQRPMGQEVIAIHGITNEMVEHSPSMEKVIGQVREFIGESVLVAHHAPFDVGFLVVELEKYGLSLPSTMPLCSSLISRKVIKGTDNHKLQTLVKHLKINAGPAHRAESDARACLQVALHCFEMIGESATYQDLLKVQGKTLLWKNYSIRDLESNSDLKGLMEAIKKNQSVEFVYTSGSQKGKVRKAIPYGVVRNPDGDYLSALCLIDNKKKRFYLNAIKDAMPILG